ncbi:MAG: hypothetical protein IJ715_04985 [Bacilli bacterium]|nr:hypothetical protein [Bacilli bacterium]
MDKNNVDKIVKQAEANSNVENKKLEKRYLKVIKDALANGQESILESIYKLVKKEKENEKQRNK